MLVNIDLILLLVLWENRRDRIFARSPNLAQISVLGNLLEVAWGDWNSVKLNNVGIWFAQIDRSQSRFGWSDQIYNLLEVEKVGDGLWLG